MGEAEGIDMEADKEYRILKDKFIEKSSGLGDNGEQRIKKKRKDSASSKGEEGGEGMRMKGGL